MPLWGRGPNTRTLPAILLTLPPSKAADMAHLRVPRNQVMAVCRRFVPDIQVCGTQGREDLVNATMTSIAEEEYNRTERHLRKLQETTGQWSRSYFLQICFLLSLLLLQVDSCYFLYFSKKKKKKKKKNQQKTFHVSRWHGRYYT